MTCPKCHKPIPEKIMDIDSDEKGMKVKLWGWRCVYCLTLIKKKDGEK